MLRKPRLSTLTLVICLILLMLSACGGPEGDPNISDIGAQPSPTSDEPVSPTEDAPATPTDDEPFPVAAHITRNAEGTHDDWRYDLTAEELSELWAACNCVEYLGEAPEPEYDQVNFRYTDPLLLYTVSFGFENQDTALRSIYVFEDDIARIVGGGEQAFRYFSPESLDFELLDALISERGVVQKTEENIAAAEEYFRQSFSEEAPTCTLDYVTYDADEDAFFTDVATHDAGYILTSEFEKEDIVTLCFSYSADSDARYLGVNPGVDVAAVLVKRDSGWSVFNWMPL